MNSGAVRNCQAETPAARLMTSSLDFASRQKHIMPPSNTAKGSMSCTRCGSFSSDIWTRTSVVTSCLPDARRNSSTISNIATTAKRVRKTQPSQKVNWRPM